MPAAGAELVVERTKWGGRPHYRHGGRFLREDEHGWWIELRVGDPVWRGDDRLFFGQWGGHLLVPPDARWWAWFPVNRPFDLYVDIVRDSTRTEDGVRCVDMDLDVMGWPDGRVELLDEEELAEHRLAFGYPEAIVTEARAAAADVLAAVRAGAEPFASARRR